MLTDHPLPQSLRLIEIATQKIHQLQEAVEADRLVHPQSLQLIEIPTQEIHRLQEVVEADRQVHHQSLQLIEIATLKIHRLQEAVAQEVTAQLHLKLGQVPVQEALGMSTGRVLLKR